jgi:hypothetical protein
MRGQILSLTYEIDVGEGEAFALPEGVAESIPPGRWRITIRPLNRPADRGPVRGHDAFLSSYGQEDDGLYDDLPPG